MPKILWITGVKKTVKFKNSNSYRGADKSLAQPGTKLATATKL